MKSESGSKRVLVVEDHGDTAMLLGRLLQLSGYTVQTAKTGAEALGLAARESFDLLVSDIRLSDSTGCEIMRRMSTLYPVKGIAISGCGSQEDIQNSLEAGFSDHLVKPIGISQLTQAIDRIFPAHDFASV